MSFLGSSVKSEIKAKSNSEIALILFSITFSESGKEQFRKTFALYSRPIISTLNKFLDSIRKEREEGTSVLTLEEEKTINDNVKIFIAKVQNLPNEEIDKIEAIIRKEYFYGEEQLLIEGFILGIYDYVKDYFKLYYSFIEKQIGSEYNKQIEDKISNMISDNMLSSKETLTMIFTNLNTTDKYKLQTLGTDTTKSKEIIENNYEIIRKYFNYNDSDLLKRIVGYDEKENQIYLDDQTLKSFDKLEKSINDIIKVREISIKDRQKEFDEEIFSLIENIIYDMLEFRKKILTKDLYKQLTGTY